MIGLGLDIRRPHEGRLALAGSVEAAVTVTMVGAGLLVALRTTTAITDLSPWLTALILGICAASSSTSTLEEADRPGPNGSRLGDLDDLLPILLGGVILASMRQNDQLSTVSLTLQGAGIGLVVAFAGWLLVARSASENEQKVFGIGTLLLLAGAVEYLSLSALLIGLIAGGLWNIAGGPGRERIGRDVRHVQHPLIVLLLLVAGARVRAMSALTLLVPVYVVFRIVGKMAGGWLAGRIAAGDVPLRLGMYLISPGIIAVAFALNVVQVIGSDRAGVILALAVAGSLASELISLLVQCIRQVTTLKQGTGKPAQ